MAKRSDGRTPCKMGTFGPIRPTRFPHLSYQRRIDHWRLIDTSTGSSVGESYRTKTELLADLPRFAESRGY